MFNEKKIVGSRLIQEKWENKTNKIIYIFPHLLNKL